MDRCPGAFAFDIYGSPGLQAEDRFLASHHLQRLYYFVWHRDFGMGSHGAGDAGIGVCGERGAIWDGFWAFIPGAEGLKVR